MEGIKNENGKRAEEKNPCRVLNTQTPKHIPACRFEFLTPFTYWAHSPPLYRHDLLTLPLPSGMNYTLTTELKKT